MTCSTRFRCCRAISPTRPGSTSPSSRRSCRAMRTAPGARSPSTWRARPPCCAASCPEPSRRARDPGGRERFGEFPGITLGGRAAGTAGRQAGVSSPAARACDDVSDEPAIDPQRRLMRATEQRQDSPALPSQTRPAEMADRQQDGINYERLYSCRFRDIDEDRRQAVWQEIAQYIHRLMGVPDRVLDPAAGRGEFITAVPAAERWGVDLVNQGVPGSARLKMIIGDILDA